MLKDDRINKYSIIIYTIYYINISYTYCIILFLRQCYIKPDIKKQQQTIKNIYRS